MPFILLWLLLWHSWFGPDIWYQLTWGRSLIENLSFMPHTTTLLAQPIFANMYWLFQILAYGLMVAGGIQLVSFLFLLVWTFIALLWVRQTKADGFWGALWFLAFVLCAQMRFEARPESFSFLFLALELALLTHADLSRRSVFAKLVIVQILWTNCHGFFALGPLLAGALFVTISWRQRGVAWSNLKLLAAMTAATFVSPFGWRIWLAVYEYSKVSRGLMDLNAELIPPPFLTSAWPLPIFWILFLVTGGWTLYSLVRGRLTFAVLCSLAGSVLALQAMRNIPLYLILSAPMVAEILPRLPRLPKWALALPSLVALAVSVLVVRGDYHRLISSLGTFGVRLESSAYPLETVDYLKSIHFSGKIFNDSYDGGYLEYEIPGIQLTGDSYFADANVTLNYFAAIRSPLALHLLDQRLNFDALLINIENLDVVDSLWKDAAWKMAFVESHRILFLRPAQAGNFDFANVNFYHGEDLRHWTYSFAVVTWAGLAVKYQNVSLIKKLVSDVQGAPAVPSEFIKYALIFAQNSHDDELLRHVEKLKEKMF